MPFLRLCNTRTEMYAGRVVMSHVEYVPRAILRLKNGTDRRTDARTMHYAYRGERNKVNTA